MIFAKLDVCFWRHKKFKRAGVAACGFYAAALAYLRDEESPDGILDHDMAGDLLGVGSREAKKLASKLVDVGLFEPHVRGYYLVRYAEKNETREQIDARRTATRERQATFREKRARTNGVTNLVHADEHNALLTGSQRALVTGSGSDSRSGSSSGSLGEPERGSGLMPVALLSERVVRTTDRIPDELREVAKMIGVVDIETCWLKFCGKHADRVIHVSGQWQSYCASWRSTEARDRAAGVRRITSDKQPTEAVRVWKAGDGQ